MDKRLEMISFGQQQGPVAHKAVAEGELYLLNKFTTKLCYLELGFYFRIVT